MGLFGIKTKKEKEEEKRIEQERIEKALREKQQEEFAEKIHEAVVKVVLEINQEKDMSKRFDTYKDEDGVWKKAKNIDPLHVGLWGIKDRDALEVRVTCWLKNIGDDTTPCRLFLSAIVDLHNIGKEIDVWIYNHTMDGKNEFFSISDIQNATRFITIFLKTFKYYQEDVLQGERLRMYKKHVFA